VERRQFIALAGSALAAPLPVSAAERTTANARLAELERETGGRLGVAVLDTGTGRRIAYRAEERFAMCSTFKFLAAAAVLARVDAGRDRLDRRVPYSRNDLLDYAPVTRAHLRAGAMTLGALCGAAIEYSDNTAANLLLATIGGPAGLTRYVRALGDPITRLDRTEPTLNTALPGDPRDTTTPAAMQGLMQRILLGEALTPRSRHQLEVWLAATKTGNARLRAGIPSGWRVGDKTGTGYHGATNDIAIVRPPSRAPILITSYYVDSPAPDRLRDAVLAKVARVLFSTPSPLSAIDVPSPTVHRILESIPALND
jgi:beta-lactamase class A